MHQELVRELLARIVGLYLILELLILALNPIPDTAQEWKTKKNNVLRRVFYLLALNVAIIWLLTL